MLIAVRSDGFDYHCDACKQTFANLPLERVQVVDLRALNTTSDNYHFQVECPNCSAGESWPNEHSPVIHELEQHLHLT